MAKNKPYRHLIYWLLVAVRAVLYLVPYKSGFSAAGALGRLTFRLLSKEREKTLSHLRLAFANEKSESEIVQIGEGVFEHFGQTLFELAMIGKLIPRFDDYVRASGYENFDKGLKTGKGGIGRASCRERE